MPSHIYVLAFVLACLACEGHARRLLKQKFDKVDHVMMTSQSEPHLTPVHWRVQAIDLLKVWTSFLLRARTPMSGFHCIRDACVLGMLDPEDHGAGSKTSFANVQINRRLKPQKWYRRTSCRALEGTEPSPLAGTLFRYRTSPSPLQAFESPVGHSHTRFCLYVGGLTDGLLACPYVEALAAECDARGWALVQPIISSSYAGYGCSSLAQDVAELTDCLSYLREKRGATAFALVGHSTGCQDAVHLLATALPSLRKMMRAVVLQAPVSDRESATLKGGRETREALLAEANRLIAQGRGLDLLSKKHYGFVPITAERYSSLVGRGGPDDLFSSDFTDAELRARLAHLSTAGQREARGELAAEAVPDHPGLKVLFVHSVGEEYVPPSVDVPRLSQRFVAAAGAPDARALLIEDANHNLSEPKSAAALFLRAVGELLA